MGQSDSALRAVVAVPLREDLCRLVEQIEPRLELVRDHTLVPPARGPGDWSGDPSYRRTADQQRAFDALVDSADALFGIPDVDPAALHRTVVANPRLRWVMTTAAGGGAQVRDADLPREALDRLTFTTSAGVHGAPLTEFAVLGVLAGAKDLPRLQADQRDHRWPGRWRMRHLVDMTVLVVGLGGIGATTARTLSALGATAWGVNRSGGAAEGVSRTFPLAELAAVVPHVDAVVLTLPGTAATHHAVGEEVLAAVRPGTILVNVGRGTAVDEDALIRALDDGRIGFAALDVVEREPLVTDSPLWDHPRVLLSPHTAALSADEDERIARRFAEDARRLIDGEALTSVVDTVEFY